MADLGKVFQGQKNRKKVSDVADSDDKLDALKGMIQSNIKAQMTNSTKVVNRSLSEMTAMRDAIKSNVVDLGKDKDQYLKTFNRAIESSTETSLSLKHVTEKATSGLLDSIPSSDSIIGALTVSNPVVGMSIGFVKKLYGDLKDSKRINDEQKAKELENLKNDAELLEEKSKQLKDSKQGNSDESLSVDNSSTTELVKIKDSIQEQSLTLEKLHDIWSDDPLNNVVEGLEKVNESIEETNDELVKASDQNELDSLAQKERLKEQNQPDKTLPISNGDDENNSEMLNDVGGMFPKFGGLLGNIGRFIKTGIKFLGPIVAVGLALFNAFKNSSDILGKAEEDLTVFDRLSVFFGSFVGAIGAIFDVIAMMFGIDTNIQEWLTKEVSLWLSDFTKGLSDFLTNIGKWLGRTIFDIVQGIQNFDLGDTVSDMIQTVKDKISGIFETIKEFVTNTVSNMVDNLNPANWSIFGGDEDVKVDFDGVDTASTKLKEEQAIDKQRNKSENVSVNNKVSNTNIVNKTTTQTFMKRNLSSDDNIFKQNNQMETIYGA